MKGGFFLPLVLVMLSIAPSRWDGSVWVQLGAESKLAYVSGLVGGLLVASDIESDSTLRITVPLEDLVAILDLYFLDPSLRYVTIPQAIRQIGGR